MYVEQQYIRPCVVRHAQGRFHRCERADTDVTRGAVDDQAETLTRGAIVFDNCNPDVFAHRPETFYPGILGRVKRPELNALNRFKQEHGYSPAGASMQECP